MRAPSLRSFLSDLRMPTIIKNELGQSIGKDPLQSKRFMRAPSLRSFLSNLRMPNGLETAYKGLETAYKDSRQMFQHSDRMFEQILQISFKISFGA